MSFILDALRKSETERQKQSAPGLADTRYKVPDKRQSIWIPLLVIFLAANAVVLSIFLLSDKSPPVQPVAVTPTEAPDLRPAEPATNRAPEADVRPLYKEAAPATRKVAAPVQQPKTPATPAVVAAAEPPVAVPIADPPPATVSESLPRLQQLVAGGIVSLPTLHLDIHVHSPDVAQRFVFINMNKYREGDVLKEGPTVEEITSTGTILSHQGNRFTLERQ